MKDPLERVAVAREFHVRKWLVDAYQELIIGDLQLLEPSRCMEAMGSQALARLLYARAEHGTFLEDTARLAEHLNSGDSGLTYLCPKCGRTHQLGNQSPWCARPVVFYGELGVVDPDSDSSRPMIRIIERLFAEELEQMG